MLSPLFIVGSPRSGTSILTQALRLADYAGYAEGNFLSLLHTLGNNVDRHFTFFASTDPDVLTTHIDRDTLKSRLFTVLRDMVEERFAGQPWLDKTGNPEMIAAIPILRTLWPHSAFIFAKRRAIENIVSRLKKFPQYDLAYHCADWTRNMATWRQIRDTEQNMPFLEIDQWDIANHPATTAQALVDFLNLPEQKAKILEDTFVTQHPQQTYTGSAQRTLTLTETGWTTAEQQIFRKHCDELMKANAYTEDSSYRLFSTLPTLACQSDPGC